jgi:cytosine/adenosine deaminase-related metal-dependent hydrolase
MDARAPDPSTAPTRWVRSERCLLGGVDEPLREAPATLEVRGATLAAVHLEPRAAWLRRAEEGGPGERLDAGSDLVAPAFVDAHVHTPMLYFRGLESALTLRGNVIEELFYRVEVALQPGDVRAFARLGAFELLGAGTATVWEHYYAGLEAAEGLAEAGLTGFVAPTLQDVAGPGVPSLEAQLEATLAIAGDARLRAHGVHAALGPHATDTVSPALWTRVGELAAAHDLTVHSHLAQSIEEVERAFARHGCSPVELLERSGLLARAPRALLVHGIFLSDADLARLDPRRHVLGFCPFSQLQFTFPADVLRWSRAGMRWLVATDCAACNDGLDVQKELRFVAGLRGLGATWSPEQARFGATGALADARALDDVHRRGRDAAPEWGRPEALLQRVWGVPGALDPRWPTGAIEPGRVASLTIWQADHPALWPCQDALRALAMGSPLPALRELIVAGRPVGAAVGLGGRAAGPEVAEAAAEARRRLELLLGRLRLA